MGYLRWLSRAIRKAAPAVLSAAAQLPLLIRWRSSHSLYNERIHASMIRSSYKLWLNWC